jgi:hypothetical protein
MASADEQNQTASCGYALDNFASATQVGCRDVEGDDVDRVVLAANTENVLCVYGVPEGRGVAEVRLRGHKEFQSHILRPRRVVEQLVWFVEIDRAGSKAGGDLLLVLEELPVLDGGIIGVNYRLRP